ncbi:STAS/SEC14 domain-containing protein [Evansella clarkii]|uniref:STAS/SEC14 domain-containing protein n=1 Tax=Evansella clarkii TaxID=79879 RepID=UPI00142FEC9D|nr:STAS/SEC14 domain-containing protein [Evansella clarkii]
MIQELPVSGGKLTAFEVKENVTEEEFNEAAQLMKNRMDEHENIRLLVKFHELPVREVSSITDRISFAKDNLEHIEKYAIVGDSKAFAVAAKLVGSASDTEIKRFELSDEERALDWVLE